MIKINKLPEIICLCIFIILTSVISIYHEPWFDEFQSWAISQDTVYNILFVIPHLEGHPPLWHLILKCFSFFNINAEAGLKIPNLLFMYGAVWLLLFKSSIPSKIKLILPFTYFIFYQYSIVSRPYSIFCFALFLSAYFYKNRNINPFKFIFSLVLLCFSCVYGMVIATGISIVWFIEITKSSNFSLIRFFKDKRFFSILILFFTCVYIVLTIFPDNNVYFDNTFSGIIKRIYVFFILPTEALFTDFTRFLPNVFMPLTFIYSLIGICTLIFIIYIIKTYKALLLFLIPYSMFLCTALMHIGFYHIGLITVFFIFIAWCILAEPQYITEYKFKKIFKTLLIFSICIQLYWSVSACLNDIKYNYWYGRSIAEYIKKNKLENKFIMSQYTILHSLVNKDTGKVLSSKEINTNKISELISKYNTKTIVLFHQNWIAVSINSYFNHNAVKNFNIYNPDKKYILMKTITDEEQEKFLSDIRKQGIPDIYIGDIQKLYYLFPKEEINNAKYKDKYSTIFYRFFKSQKSGKDIHLYERTDIDK